MDNDAVASALCQCKILEEKKCKDLKQNLSVYQMSRLCVQIILHVNQFEFEKITSLIKSREQLKCLKYLYDGKL